MALPLYALAAALFAFAMHAQTKEQTPGHVASLGPHLQANDPALALVTRQMTALHWSGIRLFATQSFPLLVNGRPAGTLVSGDAHPGKNESDKCFLILLEPGRPLTVLTTVDEIQYVRGIPACQSVRALGLVPSPNPALIRIGILYTISGHIANNPHGVIEETDVVVVAFDLQSHRIAIDQAATDKAGSANPQNLPALAAAIQ